MNKGLATNKQCSICRKPFRVYGVSGKTRKCCSETCRAKWMSLHYKPSQKQRKAISKGTRKNHKTPAFRKKMSAIRRRVLAEGRGRLFGADNHWWRGGKSFEEYGREFDSHLKEKIRFLSGYKCQRCGCTQLEAGQQLCVHHKDRNKQNNKLSNLTALCRSCHTAIHNAEEMVLR